MPFSSGTTKANMSYNYTKTVGLGTAQLIVNPSPDLTTWGSTDAINGVQLMYTSDDLSVLLASPTSLDLVSALIDPLTGTAQTWTKVKQIYIKNNSTTAGNTIKLNGNFITSSVLGGTTPYLILDAGGSILLKSPSLAGYTVTATSADTITLQGLVADVTVDLILLGIGTVA